MLKSLEINACRLLFALGVTSVVAGVAPIAQAQNQFDLNEQTFNQWLYGNSQPLNVAATLSAEIDAVDRVCNLTPQQKRKLKLAGRGDEVRFADRVAELHDRLVGKSYDQNEVNEIYQQIQPLAMEFRSGVLGKTSLFRKVLNHTLDPEQKEKFEQVQAERRAARHAARVKLFIVQLERSCPLTNEQRDNLRELLLTETNPPTRASEYDSYVLLYEVSKVPPEKFVDLLDGFQLRVFNQHIQQGRGMEQFLRQQGLLGDDIDDDD